MNTQIDLFVSTERAKGVPDETIKASLKSSGLSDAQIADAMKVVVTPTLHTTPWMMYALYTAVGLGAVVAVWYFVKPDKNPMVRNDNNSALGQPTANTSPSDNLGGQTSVATCSPLSVSVVAEAFGETPNAQWPGQNPMDLTPPNSYFCNYSFYLSKSAVVTQKSLSDCKTPNSGITCSGLYDNYKSNPSIIPGIFPSGPARSVQVGQKGFYVPTATGGLIVVLTEKNHLVLAIHNVNEGAPTQNDVGLEKLVTLLINQK